MTLTNFKAMNNVTSARKERRSAMFKTRLTSLGLAGLVLASAAAAPALTTSDRAAGILVWPKVLVDTQGTLTGVPTDTVITLGNNSSTNLKQAHCFYINATSHCANDEEQACFTASDCNDAACEPGWNKVDFNIYITANQPLGWSASDGLRGSDLPINGSAGGTCSNKPQVQCISSAQCGGGTCLIGPNGQNNIGTAVPPVPEDPFIGSLTCIQFDPAQNPPVQDQTASRNALIGEGTVVTIPDSPNAIDGAKYNAVGFRALGVADTDDTIELGGASADYDGCAQTLILDHFFDDAIDPTSASTSLPDSDNGATTTELTLVPCGNNILTRDPGVVVAQFLVFNEFEQRFSASRTVDCLLDTDISNIDTPNRERSIFNAGVSGTLVGQTRIQGVGNASTGRGLIGVARQLVETDSGAGPETGSAFNLDQTGSASTGDVLTLP